MKFEQFGITPAILSSLVELGYRRPTDIQYKAITPILAGEDVLAIAQTGTGKTAAFAIPVIHLLHEAKSSRRSEGIKCVVMVPTHELALQIREVFDKIGSHTRVKTYAIFGGVEQAPQIAQLERGIDVLIATPGRLFDLVSQGYLHLNSVEHLVLDEADHMLDLGFVRDIQDLIHFLPKKRQTLFFSATIDEKIKTLAYSLVRKAIRIQISPKDPVAKNIKHAVSFVEMDDKRFFLERIVRAHPENKILAFVRTKVRAERVSKAMERVSIESLALHGDMPQADRLSVMKQFRQGTVRLLIATDVSARGIDIPDVDYVINYDLPEQAENYVHRVGRTGRGIQKGQAIAFCSEEEKPLLAAIEAYISKPIEVLPIDRADYSQTVAFTRDTSSDWKALLREAAKPVKKKSKKRKR